jgi:hypothetical protein
MKRIVINPYSADGGLSIAFQICKAADGFFESGQAMGWCAIHVENNDLITVKELLKENKLQFRVEGE